MKGKEPFLEPVLRRLRIQRVIKHVPKSCVILDIGCGKNAAFLSSISPRIKQGIGIDFKVNENILIPKVKTIQLRLESELPFNDCSFDVVTMLAVLEHIENEKQILSEIHRVLVPGGKLILTVPSIWSQPILEFLSYKLKIISEAEIKDHKRYYRKESLRKILIDKTDFDKFNHHYFQCWMNNFCTVEKRI